MSVGLRPCIPLLCSVAALWACAAPANSASQLQLYIQDRTYQLGVYGPTQQAIYTVAIHALRSTLRDVKTPKPFLLDPLIYDGVVYPVHLTALDTAWTAKAVAERWVDGIGASKASTAHPAFLLSLGVPWRWKGDTVRIDVGYDVVPRTRDGECQVYCGVETRWTLFLVPTPGGWGIGRVGGFAYLH